MTTTLKIEGMSCQNCVAHATKALQQIDHVQTVHIDLEAGTGQVEHEGASLEEMVSRLDDEGYTATVLQ